MIKIACNNDGHVLRDHFAIVCNVEHQKTTKFKFDVELFCADIQSSSILYNTSGSLDDITQRYISGLSELIDSHAPVVQRTQISKPHAIWYNLTISEAKQVQKKLERVWQKTELPAHHEAYIKQCSEVAKSYTKLSVNITEIKS